MPAFAREARFFIGLRNYWLDGDSKVMDVAPFIKDGRTYILLRYAAYAVGASENNILYADGWATIIKGDRVLRVAVGSCTMLVNGKQVTIDVTPVVVSGSDYGSHPLDCRELGSECKMGRVAPDGGFDL